MWEKSGLLGGAPQGSGLCRMLSVGLDVIGWDGGDLRMELSRIERLSPTVALVVSECRGLVDEIFRTVRSLALGLRPSMLDDLG
jgi:hypothetical protein